MLRDLRVKIRNRHSRISSCGFEEFLPLTKQFFGFIEKDATLKAVIAELLARNPKAVDEARTADPNDVLYGDTDEEAAAIGYTKWLSFSSQTSPHGFYSHGLGGGNFQETSGKYKDYYVEPLFDYLDETLEDANVILSTLTRYKQKVEWYRRSELAALFESDTSHGEKRLAEHMYEFLFDQGLPFHVEPKTASGRPDVVSLEDSEHPFIGDVKIFDPEGSRGASYIKKGFHQVYQYCCDFNEPLGHMIVFNLSHKQLLVELPSQPDGIPRFEHNHKTIFLTVIDVHEHEETASKRGLPETVTISSAELVHEVEAETSGTENKT